MHVLGREDLIKQTKCLQLLYVEDSEDAREVAVEFLNVFFKEVVTAKDGKEGLALFKAKKFDLVMTDINMPNMNGLELIAAIREINPSIPLLILSAHSDEKYFIEGIRCGVDAYLLKAFEMENFIVAIDTILKKIGKQQKHLAYKTELEDMIKEKNKQLASSCLEEFNTDLASQMRLEDDLKKSDYKFMLLLELSNFSEITQEHGKKLTKHIVFRTACVLKKLIHTNAKLYQLELNRFVILIKNVSKSDVNFYCEQIVSFFDLKSVKIDDLDLHIIFNIGVDKIRKDPSKTVINCEYALEKSKTLACRHYEIYSEKKSKNKDTKEFLKSLHLTRELVLGENIEPYFQAIKNIQTDEITRYEVLARGILDTVVISPVCFRKQSEKLGLSTSITRMIIVKSFVFFQDKEFDFSINLGEKDLEDNHLLTFLQEKLQEYAIDPKRITFEILENTLTAHNSKSIIAKLHKIKALGCKLAIDDFGINNSNFYKLLEINFDFIKIESLFIKNLKKSKKHRIMLKAIVELAHTLGIKTIAGFVEDEEIYDIIKKCGINFAQGYYIGKPNRELV